MRPVLRVIRGGRQTAPWPELTGTPLTLLLPDGVLTTMVLSVPPDHPPARLPGKSVGEYPSLDDCDEEEADWPG